MTTTINRYPNDPCLNSLIQSLEQRMKIQFSEQIQISSPVVVKDGGGCNTEVKIYDGSAHVPIRYNRHDLSILIGLASSQVLVPFIPGPDTAKALIEAVSAHYGRLIALVDVDPLEWNRITAHPNGTYSLLLRAVDTSFGWTGEITVLFKVAGNLNDIIVETDLGDLEYP